MVVVTVIAVMVMRAVVVMMVNRCLADLRLNGEERRALVHLLGQYLRAPL